MLKEIIDIICIVYTVFSLVGFWAYKSQFIHVERWEDSLKLMFRTCFQWLAEFAYEKTTGKPVPRKIENSSLMLSNEELSELIRRLKSDLYELPTRGELPFTKNGIACYEISAKGLIPRLKDAGNEEIADIAYRIIEDYYMESRAIIPYICIRVATPKRLIFEIPLSEDGIAFLNQQSNVIPDQSKTVEIPDTPEEEINLFPDMEKREP